MARPRRTALLTALAALLVLPLAHLPAQDEEEGLTIEFELEGPVSGIPVSTIINGSKQPTTRTGSGGTVTVPFDLVNAPKPGDRVRVVLHECEDGLELVFVPEGEEDDCDDEECDCWDLGFIIWGETRRIAIFEDEEGFGMDVATGTIETEGGPITLWRPGFYASLYAGFDHRPQLEEVAIDLQPNVDAASEVDDVGLFVGAGLEYRPLKWLGLGVSGSWASHNVLQDFVQDTLPVPETGEFDMTTWMVGPHLTLSTYVTPRAELYGKLTKQWWRNVSDVLYVFSDRTEEEDRTADGWRDGFGGGVRYWATPKFALMVGAEYLTSFEDDDADDSLRGYFGVGISNVATCGGTCFTPNAGGNR